MKKLMMVVMAMGMAAAAWADVSFLYSGQLRSETGGAVGVKNQKITFSLYNAATQGTVLWSRMVPVQLDDNGYFAVELSNAVGSPVVEAKLEEVLANNANLYIGLNVKDSSGEISPRQRLLSTPRAAFAEDVKTAKDGFTVNGAAVFVNGLTIGSGTSATAEIKADGTINAKSIQQGGNVLIPQRVVVMWSGAVDKIPDGWALCDGGTYTGSDGKNVTTPDLRGKFIVGYNKEDSDYDAIGDNGGSATCTLTTNNIPPHRHQYFNAGGLAYLLQSPNGKDLQDTFRGDDSLKDLSTRPSFEGQGFIQNANWEFAFRSDQDASSVWEIFNTGSIVGSSDKAEAFENRPPYYTLAYIMKL